MQNRVLFSVAAAVFLAPLFAGSPYAQQGQAQQTPQAQQPAPNPNGGQPGAPAGRAGAAGRGRGGRAPAPSKPAPRLSSGRVQLNEKVSGSGAAGAADVARTFPTKRGRARFPRTAGSTSSSRTRAARRQASSVSS